MSTAPVLAPAVARSVPVADGAPLLSALPDARSALAWVRRGEGLVGWGCAARLDLGGSRRFQDAQQWWAELAGNLLVDDQVGRPGSGPVAFASFAFDDQPGTSVVTVPEVVLGRRDGRTWLTTIGSPGPRPRTGGPVRAVRRRTPRAPENLRYAEGSRPVSAWRDAVATAVERIRRGELDKVVLARDLVALAATDVDVRWLLDGLSERYPDCWVFSCDGLVGATPELLVRREGSRVTSRVLAGTAWRHEGVCTAADLAAELLSSAKNRAEHDYAARSAADALAPHCAHLDMPDTPEVLHLANLVHLCTEVTGRLADGSTALELAAALHPTAAVCGTPTEAARAVIRELEGMDRGRYAGPVGWMDASGDGEFGIALRCAEVVGPRVRLFAGCGLVAGSDPDTEVEEAQTKFVPIRDALGGDR